jgi:hypothetical protein
MNLKNIYKFGQGVKHYSKRMFKWLPLMRELYLSKIKVSLNIII